eukprot:TRINITY_DN17736_c0_g1_i1.p1 TRINITY_DN17736_c0_g1~~TRINITY_DN17736_c0_g1_i1.p1  ORF type:complete len:493 (+),score=88.96 TRINITY_DN17736_c0_g1_i1:119-1597(+)
MMRPATPKLHSCLRARGIRSANPGFTMIRGDSPRTAMHPDLDRVPGLAHGLETLVNDKGLLGTRINNTGKWFGDVDEDFQFPSALRKIVDPDGFDFGCISPFVPPSEDQQLLHVAKDNDCVISASTSSITPMLSQLYILMSNYQTLNFPRMSSSFRHMRQDFTKATISGPCIMQFTSQEGVCLVDKPSSPTSQDQENVLMKLGNMLEKCLTMEKSEFDKLMLNAPAEHDWRREIAAQPQTYSFLQVGDCIFRSQLDCYDKNTDALFDLKTRATAPIRYNLADYKESLHRSHLNSLQGKWFSFEREYYDLIRSKFLAFSYQLRIGGMHGVFVAYHNTAEIFGFQYVPLTEIDNCIYGSSEMGQLTFEKGCHLLSDTVAAIRGSCDLENARVVSVLNSGQKTNSLDIYVDPEISKPQSNPTVFKFSLELERTLNSRVLGAKEPVDFKVGDDLEIAHKITSTEFKSDLLRGDVEDLKDQWPSVMKALNSAALRVK